MFLLKKGEKPKPICRVCWKLHDTKKCPVLRHWQKVAERVALADARSDRKNAI